MHSRQQIRTKSLVSLLSLFQLHFSLSKQTKPFTILYSTKKVPLHHLACNQIHTRFLSFHGYCSLMQSIASLQPSPAESRGSHTLFFHRLVCCAWEGNGTLTLVPISLWTLETSRQWMNTNESYLLKKSFNLLNQLEYKTNT